MTNLARAIVLTCAMFLLGYLMVCRLKFPSLKMLRFRILSFRMAFLTVICAVFTLYGILYFFPVILAFVSWMYVLLALILASIRFFAGKHSKTLKDFEPDPDEFDL